MHDPHMPEVLAKLNELEERIDLLETPWYRRWAFYVNGWPRLRVDAAEQRWRPWHRWFGRRDLRRTR